MEIKVNVDWTVSNLINLKKESALTVNLEYQRGLRWNNIQNQMFIDSIFREYSIPAFYFHKVVKKFSGNKYHEIVDGQQRINAITSFKDDAFVLLNPNDDAGFKFPNFLQGEYCPWAGKRFSELSEELQNKMMNHKLVVYEIVPDNKNQIRDLFIRLQGGTPLTPQDKRDSWPGGFTEFVLTVGGKTNVDKWYGLPLFLEIANISNESRRRQRWLLRFIYFIQPYRERTIFVILIRPILTIFTTLMLILTKAQLKRRIFLVFVRNCMMNLKASQDSLVTI